MKDIRWSKLKDNVYFKSIHPKAGQDYIYISYQLNSDGTYNLKYINYVKKDFTARERYVATKNLYKDLAPSLIAYNIMEYYGYYEWTEESVSKEQFIDILEEYAFDLIKKIFKEDWI